MIRRRFLEAVGGILGLSSTGASTGTGASDDEVRAAVEQAETDSGAEVATDGGETAVASNAWSIAGLDVGELQSEVDDIRVAGSAETITADEWDPFVGIDVTTEFGLLYLSFPAEEARQLGERLEQAADEAEAEATAAEEADDWDDLHGGAATGR
jgi:hypothetical protein